MYLWVLDQLVLQVHHRLGATDEQDGVAVVQPPHLVWRQKFAAALLKIGGPGARAALALTMGFRMNRGFAQGLGDVLVRTRLIAAQV